MFLSYEKRIYDILFVLFSEEKEVVILMFKKLGYYVDEFLLELIN